jgi:stringent starvation protein B
MTSSRPYFIRAVNEWILDNHLTPHVLVFTTKPGVQVPMQFSNEDKIVLNIHPDAIHNLVINNDWVNFEARFSGVKHQLRLPMQSIHAIYAMENGKGMFFEDEEESSPPDLEPSKPHKSGPNLKIVK